MGGLRCSYLRGVWGTTRPHSACTCGGHVALTPPARVMVAGLGAWGRVLGLLAGGRAGHRTLARRCTGAKHKAVAGAARGSRCPGPRTLGGLGGLRCSTLRGVWGTSRPHSAAARRLYLTLWQDWGRGGGSWWSDDVPPAAPRRATPQSQRHRTCHLTSACRVAKQGGGILVGMPIASATPTSKHSHPAPRVYATARGHAALHAGCNSAVAAA